MSRTTWIRDASGKSVGYIDDIGTRQTLKKNNAAGTMVGYFDGKATYQNNKGSITKLGDGNMMQVLVGLLLANPN